MAGKKPGSKKKGPAKGKAKPIQVKDLSPAERDAVKGGGLTEELVVLGRKGGGANAKG